MRTVPVNTPLLDGNEKKYLMECVDSGWISSEGPFVSRFENESSEYINRGFGVCVSNGTVALDIAVKALGLGPGDEVIIPTFTIISCASSVAASGAVPVFVDCDETLNIDVVKLEDALTPKTKAIMMVHIYGLTCDVDMILRFAEKHGLKVIEDAAEAHGQLYKGKKCGSFGDVSIFSFYPNKHITTGEGGFIATNSLEIFERCSSLRNLCFDNSQRFIHQEIGTNARMTNMQAALGVAQLERIDEKIKKKREIGRYYNENLNSIQQLKLPIKSTAYCENIYWVYPLVIQDNVDLSGRELCERLGKYNIGTRPFFYPMHLQPCFKSLQSNKFSNYDISEKMYAKGLYIPSGLALSEDDMEYVCNALKEIFA